MWRKSIIVGKFFSQNKKKWEMKIAPVYYQLCKSYSSFYRKKEKPRRRSGFFLKKTLHFTENSRRKSNYSWKTLTNENRRMVEYFAVNWVISEVPT